MATSDLQLFRDPNGLPGANVWLLYRYGDQTFLVAASRADIDAIETQPKSRAEQDELIQKNLHKLGPLIEAKREQGDFGQQPMANGTPLPVIELSRAELAERVRTPVEMSTPLASIEWGSQQSRTEAIGGLNIADPLRTGPQQQPEPQQPTMSPGVLGNQPGSGTFIDEQRGIELPDELSLPAQNPRAARFTRTETGIIGLAEITPDDRLSNSPEVLDFYVEVRDKAREVTSLGANVLGARLQTASQKFWGRLPEDPSKAVQHLVWSSGNTLRSIIASHDLAMRDLDNFDRLDSGAAERLRDLVDTFNQLAIADPGLRERDVSRAGPQENTRAQREIELGGPIASQAARDRGITTSEAGEEIEEQLELANEADEDLKGRLTVEFASVTQRNFFAGGTIAVYRTMRALPASARGEGGFISKEYFSGFYKAAGRYVYSCCRDSRCRFLDRKSTRL